MNHYLEPTDRIHERLIKGLSSLERLFTDGHAARHLIGTMRAALDTWRNEQKTLLEEWPRRYAELGAALQESAERRERYRIQLADVNDRLAAAGRTLVHMQEKAEAYRQRIIDLESSLARSRALHADPTVSAIEHYLGEDIDR